MDKMLPASYAQVGPTKPLMIAKNEIISALIYFSKKGIGVRYGSTDIEISASDMKKLINDAIQGKYSFSGAATSSDRLQKALAKSYGLGAGGEKVRLKPLQLQEEKNKSFDLEFKKWSKLWK